MDALIQLREVSKRYVAGGPPALDRVSLEVAAGEAVAVMGPSGSRKSTLLNLVAGLEKPTSGTVTVAGQRIDTLSETRLARYRRTQLGMASLLQPAGRPHRRRQRAAARPARRDVTAESPCPRWGVAVPAGDRQIP